MGNCFCFNCPTFCRDYLRPTMTIVNKEHNTLLKELRNGRRQSKRCNLRDSCYRPCLCWSIIAMTILFAANGHLFPSRFLFCFRTCYCNRWRPSYCTRILLGFPVVGVSNWTKKRCLSKIVQIYVITLLDDTCFNSDCWLLSVYEFIYIFLPSQTP